MRIGKRVQVQIPNNKIRAIRKGIARPLISLPIRLDGGKSETHRPRVGTNR